MVYFIFEIPVTAPSMSILRFLSESVRGFIDFCSLVRLFQTFFLILCLDGSQGHSWALYCVQEGFVSGESWVLVPPGHSTLSCSVS